MIAEPYICIKGPHQGVIEWTMSPHGMVTPSDRSESWKPYADFEREKLEELTAAGIESSNGWHIYCRGASKLSKGWYSKELTGYSVTDYENDSESDRLLARAEFLKAVCEKEGVEWLPKENRCTYCGMILCGTDYEGKNCQCSCHKKPEKAEEGFAKNDLAHMEKPEKCEHKRMTPMQIRHDRPCPDCKRRPFWELGENIDYRTCKPEEPRETECCKGFELDGVLFHECKEHRPYCAKDWPCCCTMDYYTRAEIDEKITKAKRCMWDEEREWRGALLDLLMEIITNTTQGLKYQGSKWIVEDLRRKFT